MLFTSPGHSTDVWASHRQITAGSRKSRTPEANIRGWCSDRRNAQPCAVARSAGRPLQVQAELVDSFVERISQRGRIVVEFVEEEDRELCYEEGFEVR